MNSAELISPEAIANSGWVPVPETWPLTFTLNGGSAKIMDGARVVGNATVFGGSLNVESGARVDGDVGIVGGALKREEGAIIGGTIVNNASGHDRGRVNVSVHDGDVSTEVEGGRKRESGRSRLTEAVHSFGQSVTNMSLLFVFGCVLLALATRKMETLRVEAAARPMKSFAWGIVGSFCALLAVAAMCITIVGIPFAALAVLIAVFATVIEASAQSVDVIRGQIVAADDAPIENANITATSVAGGVNRTARTAASGMICPMDRIPEVIGQVGKNLKEYCGQATKHKNHPIKFSLGCRQKCTHAYGGQGQWQGTQSKRVNPGIYFHSTVKMSLLQEPVKRPDARASQKQANIRYQIKQCMLLVTQWIAGMKDKRRNRHCCNQGQ